MNNALQKVSTKEQERTALEQIKAILATLEPDSYVNTAFKGCVEIAESNIDNDFACSLKDELDAERKKVKGQEVHVNVLLDQNKALEAENEFLKSSIDKLLGWCICEEHGDISNSDYETLRLACKEPLLDEEAKNLLQDHGFDKYKVAILHKTAEYEKSRFGQFRKRGEVERNPYYYASDYNYILFECGGYTHALVNGTIHFNIY